MNLFDLSAKLTLDSDEYESGLNRAKDMASSIGRGIGTVFKAGAATIGVATTAVGAFGAQAVKSYAEYEQLAGGIETLFGAQGMSLEEYAKKQGKAIDEVKEEYLTLERVQMATLGDASDAWKFAGLSANEYMETISGFAASLKQSVGGDMEDLNALSRIAVEDMSDNASKFGTSMEAIQNAYAGFSKQNYTMLDNLKLGYGGTKTEMERLLKDAEKLTGQKYDVSNFGDIVEAIHAIQKEMGVAGTTAKEAMFTIEGSANATKAAWSNVITAIGRGEGLDEAFEGLTTAIFGDGNGGGLLNNVIPRIQKTMEGIGDFLVKISPILTEKIPQIIDSVLPSLLDSGVSLAGGLVKGLVKGLPTAFKTVTGVLNNLVSKLWEGAFSLRNVDFSEFTDQLNQMVYDLFDSENGALTGIMYAGSDIITTLAQGIINSIPELIPTVSILIESITTYIWDWLPKFMEIGASLISELAMALSNPELLSKLVDGAINIVKGLVEGILKALPQLIQAAPVIIANLVTALIENVPKLLEAAWEIIKEIVKGLIDNLPEIFSAAGEIIATLLKGIVELWGKLVEVGGKIIGGLITGLKAKWNDLKEAVGNIANSIKEKFKEKIEAAKTWGKDLMKNFVDGIKQKWENLKSTVSNIAQTIKNFLGFSEPKEGPLSNFHTYAPDMMKLFAQGIKDNTHLVTDQIKKSFDFGEQIIPVKTDVTTRKSSVDESGVGSGNQFNFYINDVDATPDEIARDARRELQYMLIGGASLG